MDDVVGEKSTPQISYVERMLREEMRRDQNQIRNNEPSSMVPPHRYLFQPLKSYNSNTTQPTDVSREANKVPSSANPRESSFQPETQPPPRQVKTRSIWCGGPFFCVPTKAKKHVKPPTTTGTGAQNNNELIPLTSEDGDTDKTFASSKMINETDDVRRGSKQKKPSQIDESEKKPPETCNHNKQIDKLMEQISRLKEENGKLKEEDRQLKDASSRQVSKLKDEAMKDHLDSVVKLEAQIKEANESISRYEAEIEKHKRTITELGEKLSISNMTGDLLLEKKRKDRQKLVELKAKHEEQISELQDNVEMLNLKLNEQSSEYSATIQKMNSIFDSCENFNNENTELHGDLEYTLTMIEGFLDGYKDENEKLKMQTTENQATIDQLKKGIEEKSVLADQISTLFEEFSLEKPESLNQHWVQCFREKLEKGNNNADTCLSEPAKYHSTATNTDDDTTVVDDGVKHVVSSVVDNIIEVITKQEQNESSEDFVSLTIAHRPSEDVDEKKSFELESVSIEKISKPSSSETD